ncbi:MAG: alpha/beta hydrolase [Clostridiales Family XIII bacterium]|jgi:acetyl esterase|nr:alpha/beta hydrolase [Clostridiales Family XIII bacterium]
MGIIRTYRKLFEPNYGEVAPEVKIAPSEALDLANPAVSREQIRMETLGKLVSEWKETVAWKKLMALAKEETAFERDGYRVPVTIYNPGNPVGTLLYFHGGAWSLNNPELYDTVLRGIASFGNVKVVAPDYRLAPEYKFPVGIEDCYASIPYIQENGLVSGKLFIGGDSSGGNFAAAIALMARDRGLSGIAGQILIYPCVILNPELPIKSEDRYGKGYFLEFTSDAKITSYFYFDDYDKDSDSPYASPLSAESLAGLPPCLMISAECDPLLDQELMYAARLEDEGVRVEHKLYEGMIHAFIHHPLKESFDMYKLIGNFIERS